MNGTTISIGSEIVFEHLDTSEYLSGSFNCPDQPYDSFKIKIKSNIRSMNLFKILPANSFDIEGDEVIFG